MATSSMATSSMGGDSMDIDSSSRKSYPRSASDEIAAKGLIAGWETKEEMEDFLQILDDFQPTVQKPAFWGSQTIFAPDTRWCDRVLPLSIRISDDGQESVGVFVQFFFFLVERFSVCVCVLRVRAVSLAAQKFIADVANEALHHCRQRQQAAPGKRKVIRSVSFQLFF